MLLHHAPTQYPARAALQWIPPSIPPEQLASGSRRASARAARQWISRSVFRQSCSPVDPAEYPARAAHKWIPPSIPPERLASGSRRVSRQSWPVDRGSRQASRLSGSPLNPAYPAERQVSRQSSSAVDPAEYPTRAVRQWIPPSIPLSIPE